MYCIILYLDIQATFSPFELSTSLLPVNMQPCFTRVFSRVTDLQTTPKPDSFFPGFGMAYPCLRRRRETQLAACWCTTGISIPNLPKGTFLTSFWKISSVPQISPRLAVVALPGVRRST